MRKMTSFTKERMITEIKKIKELTAKNPISSSYFQENYKTLCSYGVISELCKENFIKKQKLQGTVFYLWNFDTKMTANDYDYFFSKAIKKRSNYYINNKSKNNIDAKKEQNKIIFEQENIVEPVKKVGISSEESILKDKLKIEELHFLYENNTKEISNLKNIILQKEETIKELLCKLNEAQEKKQNFRSVLKNTPKKEPKYLKLLGIKIYEKN